MSTAQQPLRLLIRFTNKYTYAQVIAHENGNVIAAASTLEKSLRQPTGNTGKKVLNLLFVIRSLLLFDLAVAGNFLSLYKLGHTCARHRLCVELMVKISLVFPG